MAKNDKKIKVLKDRIEQLEKEMQEALGKKKSGTNAFNVPERLKLIAELKQDLKRLT